MRIRSAGFYDMVAAGIIKVLVGLQQRKMADEDIPEDVEYMYNTLQASMATMSSFDVYKKELMGGKLEWSPSHKSENFWKVRHQPPAARCGTDSSKGS